MNKDDCKHLLVFLVLLLAVLIALSLRPSSSDSPPQPAL